MANQAVCSATKVAVSAFSEQAAAGSGQKELRNQLVAARDRMAAAPDVDRGETRGAPDRASLS